MPQAQRPRPVPFPRAAIIPATFVPWLFQLSSKVLEGSEHIVEDSLALDKIFNEIVSAPAVSIRSDVYSQYRIKPAT